nr:uncharacterized protein LOC106625189 [Bactrocera oleae]
MLVQKFCCFRLESTAKFFGWLGIIGSVLLAIISIVGIANAHELSIELQKRGLDINEGKTSQFDYGLVDIQCFRNGVFDYFHILYWFLWKSFGPRVEYLYLDSNVLTL